MWVLAALAVSTGVMRRVKGVARLSRLVACLALAGLVELMPAIDARRRDFALRKHL